MWLARATRPDIMLAVGALVRQVASWSEVSDLLLLQIGGYLATTLDLALVFDAAKPLRALAWTSVEVHGLSDSDHAGDHDTSRSTSGWITVIRVVA